MNEKEKMAKMLAEYQEQRKLDESRFVEQESQAKKEFLALQAAYTELETKYNNLHSKEENTFKEL